MKNLRKISIKNTIAASVIGLFFAASLTDIAYPASDQGAPNGVRTPYIEGVVHYDGFVYRDGIVSSEGNSAARSGGAAYEDVFSHPRDLIDNIQNSQERFIRTFVVVSLIASVVLGFGRRFRMSSESNMSPEDIRGLTIKASDNSGVKEAIANKEEIRAIKIVTDDYGVSLADARNVVDHLRAKEKQL